MNDNEPAIRQLAHGPDLQLPAIVQRKLYTTFTDNRSRYDARMHKVLEYVDRHLDQSPDLAELAEVAHFSAFHFHRLFTAWMGETLGDYLRRRKLEIAATRLVSQPRLPVLQVALAVGFGSPEAFTRAFKSRFGCSPSAWRTQKSKPDQANRKMNQALNGGRPQHEASLNQTMETIMKVKLVDRKPQTIAYMRHIGPYGPALSSFWQEKVYPWMVANGLLERPRYGISLDDPGVTAPERCRYDACAEVPEDFVAVGDAFKTTIPGGKYAVLYVRGQINDIQNAWTAILRDWLPSSGFQLDARPFFEYYPEGTSYDPKTGVFDCEICIPVAPL
jgi:AraC family transcriptional regulator